MYMCIYIYIYTYTHIHIHTGAHPRDREGAGPRALLPRRLRGAHGPPKLLRTRT